MVTDLMGNANALGEEKARHAAWLDLAKTGVAMTKEQIDDIKRAIVKGRPHAAKKLKSGTHTYRRCCDGRTEWCFFFWTDIP